MLIPDQINAIEARLKLAGVSVDDFCKSCGIWRQTWTKWKSGQNEPQMRVWRRVQAALASLPQRAA